MEGRKQWQQVEKKPKGRGPLQCEVARCLAAQVFGSLTAQVFEDFCGCSQPRFSEHSPWSPVKSNFRHSLGPSFRDFCAARCPFFGASALCSLSRFSLKIEPLFSCLNRFPTVFGVSQLD